MYGEELKYVTEASVMNWMFTVGANINKVERMAAEKICSGFIFWDGFAPSGYMGRWIEKEGSNRNVGCINAYKMGLSVGRALQVCFE